MTTDKETKTKTSSTGAKKTTAKKSTKSTTGNNSKGTARVNKKTNVTAENNTRKSTRIPDKELKANTRYTKAFAQWFTERMMEEDLDIRGVVNTYPDQCPTYLTLLRWVKKNHEFDEMLTYARETQVMSWKQELDDLLIDQKNKTFSDRAEAQQYNYWLKNKLDTLKFKISKLAPLITEKYSGRAGSSGKGNNDQPIQVVVSNYSSPVEEEPTGNKDNIRAIK